MKVFPSISLKRNIDSLVAGIVGIVIIYLFTKHSGIGVSPDSITYTAGARNLRLGNGLREFTGEPMVDFPAFYPLFLSWAMFITGHDIIMFAPVLNALLFALAIYMCGCIMEGFIVRSKVYKWILLMVIAFSPCLIEIYYMLWSETLFIVWSLLFFVAFKQYLKSRSIYWLFVAALITAIAFVTRYAGISLIGTGGLLLLFDKKNNWKKKMGHILLFGTIGILLAAINLVRNYFATTTITGPRQKGITPFSNNFYYYSTVLWDWSSFFKERYNWAIVVAILITLVFVSVCLWRIVLNKNYGSYENIVLVFFIVYCATIVISSTVSRYETINNRLLAPAFIPFVWGLTSFVPARIEQIKNATVKWAMLGCCLIVAFLFLHNQFLTDHENYTDINGEGIPGYTEDVWKNSPTIRFAKNDTTIFKPDNYVYSNANHAIYFYTGKITETIPQVVHKLEVDSFYEEPTTFIVYFNTDPNPNLLSLAQIAKKKQLVPLNLFADGAVYVCTSDSLLAKKYMLNNNLIKTNIERSMPIKHVRRRKKKSIVSN